LICQIQYGVINMKTRLLLVYLLFSVILIAGCSAIPRKGATLPEQAAESEQTTVAEQGANPAEQTPPPKPETALPIPQEVHDEAFPGTIILGRPTLDSVTLNLLSSENVEFYVEYGEKSREYTGHTNTSSLETGQPLEVELSGLDKDTQYCYRIRHRQANEAIFSQGEEHSFHTQRQPGSTFSFTVQADSHLGDRNFSGKLYERMLLNALNDGPDFHIDLGDTFMAEKFATNYDETAALYLEQRSYFGLLCNSAPLFLVNGNHDGELGWELDGTPNNIAIWATNARKLIYPNPEPDDFYTASNAIEDFVGLRENYYAWQWGDALFVVLDPFWYTTTKPGHSGDNWDWTLGYEQYSWFKQTLEESDAKFKFVFCHHLVGGGPLTNEGRGGIEAAKYYEWGGLNENGTWGFDENRPNWDRPIHQLMVDSNVTIFFHGHDHFFAKQELDGIIYQETPRPSIASYNIPANVTEYGYVGGEMLGSSGHLRITVSADAVTVDYIRAYLPEDARTDRINGEIAYTYTIKVGD
jgi:hypothetical protein